jgi:hypothetical protein
MGFSSKREKKGDLLSSYATSSTSCTLRPSVDSVDVHRSVSGRVRDVSRGVSAISSRMQKNEKVD